VTFIAYAALDVFQDLGWRWRDIWGAAALGGTAVLIGRWWVSRARKAGGIALNDQGHR
jgi:hypothetical protein